MKLGNWLTLALSALVVGALGFDNCRVENSCIKQNNNEICCQQVGVNEFNIRCLSHDNSSTLNLVVKRENRFEVSAVVNCSETQEWSTFLYGSSFNLGKVKNLMFYSCNHPQNGRNNSRSMKDIVEELGVTTVETVGFQNLELNLEKDILKAFSNVETIHLLNNEIGNISQNCLQGLPKLRQLHILQNKLQNELPIGMFENTALETLEFDGNHGLRIKNGIFRGLKDLTLLHLRENGHEYLDDNLFDDLISLQTLDISNNVLTLLSPTIFENLTSLRRVDISYNNFSSLPTDLFTSNINLSNIRITNNKQNLTNLPHQLFANLPKLVHVNIEGQGFSEIPEDLFRGSYNIEILNMANNFLKAPPGNIFQDLNKLTILNLSSNNLTNLHNDTFSTTTKLKNLDLSYNQLTDVNDVLFLGLEELEEINMEHNELTRIDINAFSHSKTELKIAKFSHNHLQFNTFDDDNQPITPFRRVLHIEELYLSHNNIDQMFPVHSFSLLSNLDLSYNRIQEVVVSFLQNSADTDLRHNQITRINMENVEYMLADSLKNLTIHLDHNPIDCDCELYEFLRYFKGDQSDYIKRFMHINAESLSCHSPNELKSVKLSNIDPSSFKCRTINTDGLSTDPCSLTGGCACWNRPYDRTTIIDCSNRNLTQQPLFINALMSEKVELNLAGNHLKYVNLTSENGYENISSLNLAMNDISKINCSILPLKLQVLQLHGNNLTTLTEEFITALSNSKLRNVSLHDNPWLCDCSMTTFLSFVQIKFKIISDRQHIRCLHSNSSLIDMTINDFCTKSQKGIILMGTLVAVVGLIVGTSAALYFRFQQEIRVWLFSKNICMWLVKEDEVDNHKIYDAFVSYSHKDEDFVLKELITKLEGGPKPYTLCVHFRDWVAGEYIPTQIARSVEEAKRTIVVLSPNFLESVWGRLEFQAAHKQALSEKRTRVIILVYGDIGPIDKLDSELKMYMQTNTFVKWGDPWFWQKLYYALPHASDSEKSRGGMRLDMRKSKNINKIEKEVEQKALGYGLVGSDSEKNSQDIKLGKTDTNSSNL